MTVFVQFGRARDCLEIAGSCWKFSFPERRELARTSHSPRSIYFASAVLMHCVFFTVTQRPDRFIGRRDSSPTGFGSHCCSSPHCTAPKIVCQVTSIILGMHTYLVLPEWRVHMSPDFIVLQWCFDQGVSITVPTSIPNEGARNCKWHCWNSSIVMTGSIITCCSAPVAWIVRHIAAVCIHAEGVELL